MPGYIGFQLALDLSSIFPVRALADGTASKVMALARDLRKSGSDLVVEEDLAEVFGKGKISPLLRIASQPYVISRSCICSRSPP